MSRGPNHPAKSDLDIILDKAFLSAKPGMSLQELAEGVYIANPELMERLKEAWLVDRLESVLAAKRRRFVLEQRGLISRIAIECAVTGSAVSRVLMEVSKSERISRAIDSAIADVLSGETLRLRHERWSQEFSPDAGSDPAPEEAVA